MCTSNVIADAWARAKIFLSHHGPAQPIRAQAIPYTCPAAMKGISIEGDSTVLVKTLLQGVAKSDRKRRTHALRSLFLLASIAPALARTVSQAQKDSTASIRPFKMHVPESVLADLHPRPPKTKWPAQLPPPPSKYSSSLMKTP